MSTPPRRRSRRLASSATAAPSPTAGDFHSLALTADGAVFTWGSADNCLGHGEDLSDQLLPKKVEAWAPGK